MAHISIEETPGPPVAINCPRCGARGVRSRTVDRVENANLIFRHRTTWVTCGACGAELLSSMRADDMAGRTPADLESVVRPYHSLPARVLGVMALLLFWTPAVGQVLALVSWAANRGHRKWARASLVVLIVGVLLMAVVFGGLWLDQWIRGETGPSPH